jgi:hypothetical protein
MSPTSSTKPWAAQEMRMIDITPELQAFIAQQQDWGNDQSAEVAAAVAGELSAQLDWDRDAGEDWARVLLSDNSGVMICMSGPLVITTADVAMKITAKTGDFPVITVPSLDAIELTCDAQILRAAFGDQAWNNPALKVQHFSADELWFTTV